MVLGIKVISADGTSVGWGKALLRYIGYIISAIVLFLGFIWIAFDSKRQGWHDKIASTLVVHKDTQFSTTEPVTFVPSDQGSSAAVIPSSARRSSASSPPRLPSASSVPGDPRAPLGRPSSCR